jgi:hypothetical protein
MNTWALVQVFKGHLSFRVCALVDYSGDVLTCHSKFAFSYFFLKGYLAAISHLLVHLMLGFLN